MPGLVLVRHILDRQPDCLPRRNITLNAVLQNTNESNEEAAKDSEDDPDEDIEEEIVMSELMVAVTVAWAGLHTSNQEILPTIKYYMLKLFSLKTNLFRNI